jgi:hypothetical protein
VRRHPAFGRLVVLGTAIAVGAMGGPALAYHYYRQGWRDQHRNYPPRPNGYNQIVNVFGQPCNGNAYANSLWWRAADTGQWYRVNFHRKLGGAASSNLNNDVYGHIQNDHLAGYVRHGIYGYRFHGRVRECPGGSLRAFALVDGDVPNLGDTDVAGGVLAGRLAGQPRTSSSRSAACRSAACTKWA